MKTLQNQFKKNGLKYHFIQRNNEVALFGVSGTYTDEILHYEVCRIHIRNDKYGYREALPSNEQFGKDGSLAIQSLEKALQYFYALTASIKSSEKARNLNKNGEVKEEVVSDTQKRSPHTPVSLNEVIRALYE